MHIFNTPLIVKQAFSRHNNARGLPQHHEHKNT